MPAAHRSRAAVLFLGMILGATPPVVRAADPIIFACEPGTAYLTTSTATKTVPQGGTATFEIEIHRDAECTAGIYLDLQGGVPAGSSPTVTPYPATGNSATFTLTTSNTLPTVTPPGLYGLYFYPHTATTFPPDDRTYLLLYVEVTASTAPIISGPRANLIANSTIGATTVPVKVNWSATDPNGIGSYRLQRQVNGGTWTNVTLGSATATSITQSLTFGNTYRYRVRATDKLGNTSAYSYLKTFRPRIYQQSSAIFKSGYNWKTAYSSAASGGSYKYLTFSNANFSVTVTSASLGWVSIKGPTRSNSIGVWVNDTWIGSVNANASTVAYRKMVFAHNNASNATRKYMFFNGGTLGTNRIDNDAIVVLVQQ